MSFQREQGRFSFALGGSNEALKLLFLPFPLPFGQGVPCTNASLSERASKSVMERLNV